MSPYDRHLTGTLLAQANTPFWPGAIEARRLIKELAAQLALADLHLTQQQIKCLDLQREAERDDEVSMGMCWFD